jgi:hypothetical protein
MKLKDTVKDYFYKQEFIESKNLLNIFDESVLFLEKGDKTIIVLMYGKNISPSDFFSHLDSKLTDFPEIYFVAESEVDLYGFIKLQFFRWISSTFGNMENAKGKVGTVHFTTQRKLLKNSPWEKLLI